MKRQLATGKACFCFVVEGGKESENNKQRRKSWLKAALWLDVQDDDEGLRHRLSSRCLLKAIVSLNPYIEISRMFVDTAWMKSRKKS
eukprot:762760-Hanusia_phi.AAC.1